MWDKVNSQFCIPCIDLVKYRFIIRFASMQSETLESKKTIFSDWVTNHSDELYSWAFYKTSSHEIAQDLVQDTFLSAYKAFDNFEGRSKPGVWLFSILNNKIIEFYRTRSKRNKRIEDQKEINGASFGGSQFAQNGHWIPVEQVAAWDDENLLDNSEFLKIFSGCIEDLPDNWRFAVTSRYQMDMSSDSICQELDITPSNYWQIIHRAKLSLKKCIESKW